MDIRLVCNLTKNGTELTLQTVKVVIENRIDGRQLSSLRTINTEHTNVSSLFTEIQTKAIEVFNSALNN